MTDLMDTKKFLVLGMGRSGRAAARLLALRGYRVAIADDSAAAVASALSSAELDEPRVRRSVSAADPSGALRGCGAVVASPGVPLEHPLIAEARGRGIPVTGEIEIAYRYCSSPIIAVTGTNGKSTVVKLTAKILETAGKKTVAAGNIGVPFASIVEGAEKYDAVVLEISSFQLDTIIEFRADVAAILNITADHLDRYGDSFDLYVRSKARVLERAGENAVFVYNADDGACAKVAEEFSGRKIPFSSSRPLDQGVFFEGGAIVRRREGKTEPVAPRGAFAPIGVHNLENAMAAVALVTPFGIEIGRIRAGLESYTPLPHRMEIVGTVGGVVYINDSKATNVDATIKSLRSIEGPVVLILGGSDKNLDFRPLLDHVERVKSAVLIGETSGKIRAVLSGRVRMTQADSMEGAVRAAARSAASGDTVLLAPACASFDMFENYAHRGEEFRRAVAGLEKEAE